MTAEKIVCSVCKKTVVKTTQKGKTSYKRVKKAKKNVLSVKNTTKKSVKKSSRSVTTTDALIKGAVLKHVRKALPTTTKDQHKVVYVQVNEEEAKKLAKLNKKEHTLQRRIILMRQLYNKAPAVVCQDGKCKKC